MSPKVKYCGKKDISTDKYTCSGVKRERVYVRRNEPIIEERKTYPFKRRILGYKRKFVAIGWVCPKCNDFLKD